jgi:hypothetical protein
MLEGKRASNPNAFDYIWVVKTCTNFSMLLSATYVVLIIA